MISVCIFLKRKDARQRNLCKLVVKYGNTLRLNFCFQFHFIFTTLNFNCRLHALLEINYYYFKTIKIEMNTSTLPALLDFLLAQHISLVG